MSALPVPMSNSDIGRYMRHLSGESIEEIALVDGVAIGTVEKAVARGAAFEEQKTAMKVSEMRNRGALRNEEFRQTLREAFEPEVKAALGKLLKGKNTVVEVDKASGAVTFREYDDPNLLKTGIDIYRKTVSLEEKPAPISTIIQTNIQQNNTQNNVGADIFDFETELGNIRRKQKEAHGKVIDTTAEPESSNEGEVGF